MEKSKCLEMVVAMEGSLVDLGPKLSHCCIIEVHVPSSSEPCTEDLTTETITWRQYSNFSDESEL
jgi:hypothetical protein